ncbi:UNVERIFIED_CONTAM: hypothetical protein FKN15_041316 [Acipenser sinensis]
MEPLRACNPILACIVLHNISINGNVPAIKCEDLSDDLPEPQAQHHDAPLQQDQLAGWAVRDAIVKTTPRRILH